MCIQIKRWPFHHARIVDESWKILNFKISHQLDDWDHTNHIFSWSLHQTLLDYHSFKLVKILRSGSVITTASAQIYNRGISAKSSPHLGAFIWLYIGLLSSPKLPLDLMAASWPRLALAFSRCHLLTLCPSPSSLLCSHLAILLASS